jgi:hypothetical protein
VSAREEVTRLLEEPAVAEPPAGQQAGGFAGEPRRASPIGAVTVPPWQAVTGAAADIPAFYAARIPEPCTSAMLLIPSTDCKGIVMRPGALRAAARTT